MAEGKKPKEQQILEEAAERFRAFLKENAPIFKGEEDIVADIILGKYAVSKIPEETESEKK